jgi:L-malate glycosyltransferase
LEGGIMPDPRPIRVLMLNYEFPPFGGGTGRSCAALLDELPRQPGIAVDLITSGPTRCVQQRDDLPDLRVHRLDVGKRSSDYWTAGELASWSWQAYWLGRQLLRRERFDLLHCWGTWPAGAVGWLLPGNLPMLVSMRGSDVPGYNQRLARLDPIVFRPLARRVWRRATKLVANCDNLRQLALRTWPEADVDILPSGADPERFTPQFGRVGRRLIFLGRLIARKRVDLLIDAVGRLVETYPDIQLQVIGDGPCRAALEAQSGRSPAAAHIRFTGHLEGRALDDHIEAADMLVLPSAREGASYAALEATAAGLAIVTTDTGPAEFIDGNGIVVPVNDLAALTAAIAAYCSDPDRLLADRRRSRELALANSWHAAAEDQLLIYGDMLDRGAATVRRLSLAPSARSGTCQTVPQRVAPPARR